MISCVCIDLDIVDPPSRLFLTEEHRFEEYYRTILFAANIPIFDIRLRT